MEPEEVTFVKNQKAGDHLKDKDGFVYNRTKSVALKNKSH
jgi:hypothetical protein